MDRQTDGQTDELIQVGLGNLFGSSRYNTESSMGASVGMLFFCNGMRKIDLDDLTKNVHIK